MCDEEYIQRINIIYRPVGIILSTANASYDLVRAGECVPVKGGVLSVHPHT